MISNPAYIAIFMILASMLGFFILEWLEYYQQHYGINERVFVRNIVE
jgi:hypothetical protein